MGLNCQQEIIQLREELKDSRQQLKSVLRAISHDLKAPLRIVNSYSQILMEELDIKAGEEAGRLLGIVTSNSEKAMQMLDALLFFSSINRLAERDCKIDMNYLVGSTLDELKSAKAKGSIEFIIKDLPPVCADMDMIKTVWLCLLENAVKFTSYTTSAVIEIGHRVIDNHPAYYVRDNGVGFDMGYYKKLFVVFQRLHSRDEFEGLGVGLAKVKCIVELYGGKVWAEALPGVGATFYFTLPAK